MGFQGVGNVRFIELCPGRVFCCPRCYSGLTLGLPISCILLPSPRYFLAGERG